MLRPEIIAIFEWAWASLPFLSVTLPVGKGALILIVGGIFAASISLVWTVMMPREVSIRATPQGAWPHAQRASGRPRPVPIRPRSTRGVPVAARPAPVRRKQGRRTRLPAGIAWLGQVSIVTEQRGLGEVRPVAVWDEEHCQVRLTECRSCQGEGTPEGCEAERRLIENEMERYVSRPRVVEVDCQADHGSACVFDVRSVEAEAT